ncbi:MAG: DUF1566 domain-containing protein, partial [Spirochaetaceae bacterium]|nr:DUF1566 domain-containing protein [Spirochaetaceae bacterium]
WAIGAGYSNTQAILAASSGTSETDNAAQRAAAYTGGSKTDWFLPSVNELQALYNFVTNTDYSTQAATVNMASAVYWTSTEVGTNNAYNVQFDSGEQYAGSSGSAPKGFDYHVRPVRAFGE